MEFLGIKPKFQLISPNQLNHDSISPRPFQTNPLFENEKGEFSSTT